MSPDARPSREPTVKDPRWAPPSRSSCRPLAQALLCDLAYNWTWADSRMYARRSRS